jgi:TPR repeat protein
MNILNRPFLSALTLSLFSCTALWAMEKEEKGEDDHKSILNVPRQVDKEYSEDFIVPSGALDNEEPFVLKTPHVGFEEKIKDPQLQQNTLRSLGMAPTAENQKTYFSKPQELAQYLKQNLWGPELLLEKVSFQTPNELVILDAVGKTKSLRHLSLKGSLFTPLAYLALANAIARNKSLKVLDLTGASCTLSDLTLLGYALSQQKTLRELRLNAKFETPLTEENIKQFYEQIKTNTGLRLIIWPESYLETIRTLSQGVQGTLFKKEQPAHSVAALHRGIMFKTGVGETKNLNHALGYLELAHKLGHPLAAYEISKLYEKEAKDYGKALEWINKSTEQGSMMAFVKRGDHFRKTWPKPQDTQKIVPDYEGAYDNYKVAADQGHRRALYKLGKRYESMRYEGHDLDKAGEFYFEACQRGCPDAYTALGALYKDPKYSQYDLETAKFYLRWGQYHPKSRGTATKLLSSIEQDKKQQEEKNNKEKEDK